MLGKRCMGQEHETSLQVKTGAATCARMDAPPAVTPFGVGLHGEPVTAQETHVLYPVIRKRAAILHHKPYWRILDSKPPAYLR